ncbi:hypothetical protein N0V94_009633 [Neodidymelliopsis sp. IMI 364377]|nr:hypothetical protein N0V94_009633 [Neodidymelliopsis sp. IMI 364377]
MANLRAPAEATMAESRGVRAASRRKTPTPQPEKIPARASRRLRSASRDFEPIPELQKQTRRSARQASVTSFDGENESEPLKSRRTKRKPAKEPVGDLTAVEEIDTEIAINEAPGTPQRIDIDLVHQDLFRSPGAASEMSGTTAISSFSMIEAEFLEPKYILRHMRKLCDVAEEFLELLVPVNGAIDHDLHNMLEMQKPDSEYSADYRDFENELNVHLKHFKSEEHNYIHTRAVHRALFGSYNDVGALQSGVDLVFYLANITVFAKQMIFSDRRGKDIWNIVRQLDNSFPSQFMRALVAEGTPTVDGQSALLKDTFELGLALRTQLTILLLERSAYDSAFNPDDALGEVFLHSEATQGTGDIIRGWGVAALDGDEARLPEDYRAQVIERMNHLKQFFPTDAQSLEDGDLVDLDALSERFPWEATVLRILQWVRLRHRELSASIEAMGGSAAILANVKKAMETPQPALEETRPTTAPRDSSRKRRTSFGRNRRRSSRKFDPNAPIDMRAIDALKARERDSGVHFDPKVLQPGEEFEQVAEEEEIAQQTVEELPEVETAPEQVPVEQDNGQRTLGDDQQQGEATLVAGEEDDYEEAIASGPPKSTQEQIKVLHAIQKLGKENRKGSFFDRQITAQRVEFGDPLNSQPTPGPSNRVLDKGKQRADPPPSVSRKRARAEEVSDDDDDTFESGERTARIQDRRTKAPVSKKPRLEPPSSAPAPPSHQPVRAPADDDLRIPTASAPHPEQAESNSETEAPEMTEAEAEAEEPPTSTYQAQHRLALQNSAIGGAGRARQPRRTWSMDAEEAFVQYMEALPRRYADIKTLDSGPDGYGLLEEFTQVNLKDKARTMAINMIK